MHTGPLSIKFRFDPRSLLIFFAGVLLTSTSSFAHPPLLLNYQGRLLSGTNLVNGTVGLDLRLYDNSSGGALLYADSNAVTVVDGLYSTYLGDQTTAGSLVTALTNAAVWVEVRVNGTPLTPRERLAAVGYALATRGLTVSSNVPPGLVLGTDASGNAMDPTAAGAVIGGGSANTIDTNADYSVVAGGSANIIYEDSQYASIGGGIQNIVGNRSTNAVIAGGANNFIDVASPFAAVLGGDHNRINSLSPYAAVLGGVSNEAAGYAAAAGRRAKARHAGAFVWGDSQDADFASTASNQFLIRAQNGVGINTNAVRSGAALEVSGEAVIGGATNSPRFGMRAVYIDTNGVVFAHPGMEVALRRNSATRALTLINSSVFYYVDCSIRVVTDPDVAGYTTNAQGRAADLVGGHVVTVTNATVTGAGGWEATAVKEQSPGPGFIFHGNSYQHTIGGLVTYWY